MKSRKKKKIYMIIGIIAGVIIATGVAGIVFVNRPQFGRLPQGERLE